MMVKGLIYGALSGALYVFIFEKFAKSFMKHKDLDILSYYVGFILRMVTFIGLLIIFIKFTIGHPIGFILGFMVVQLIFFIYRTVKKRYDRID